MDTKEIIKKLETLSDSKAKKGMEKVGITAEHAYCVSLPYLRAMAQSYGRNHPLALQLWEINNRETRILAGMIAEPEKVTDSLFEQWSTAFTYWEICDQCVMNLFEKTPLAWSKALEYSTRKEEFVKRTGFVLMARLAVSDKKAPDTRFEPFFPLIIQESIDERNMVKKAVNWALRQIGKRNINLNRKAIAIAREIMKLNSKSARWIAGDALRELESTPVQKRLKEKKGGNNADCL